MGVTGVPDTIRLYGEMFRGIPETKLPPKTIVGPGGPLSGGLAGVQNLRAVAAEDFARERNSGTVAAGDGLIRIAANLADFDRKGADAIRRLFPGGQ